MIESKIVKTPELKLKIVENMKSIIEQNQKVAHVKDQLIDFIHSFFFVERFPKASRISKDIDKAVFFTIKTLLINDAISPELLIKENVENLLSQYQSVFNDCSENYLSTSTHSYPDIDCLLCLFLQNFLHSLSFPEVLTYIFELVEKFIGNLGEICLESKIKAFEKLEIREQYIYAEIFLSLSQPKQKIKILNFLFKDFERNLDYKEIKKEWADDFIDIACKPIFKTILDRFIPKKNKNLKVILQSITPRIVLCSLPENLYGVTQKNLTIIIKNFNNEPGCKGATFAVFLHELAHYLQRIKSKTIRVSCERKSDQFTENAEGGFEIEKMIFGSELKIITEEAADYLVSKNLPEDISVFQQEFQLRNTNSSNGNVINLSRSGNDIYLGRCGSYFGDI